MDEEKYITYKDFTENKEGCYDLYKNAADNCKTVEEKELINSFMQKVCSSVKAIAKDVFEEIMEQGIHSQDEFDCYFRLICLKASVGWFLLTAMIEKKTVDENVKKAMYETLIRTYQQEGDLPVPLFDYIDLCQNELDMVTYQKKFYHNDTPAKNASADKSQELLQEKLYKISQIAEDVSEKACLCSEMKEAFIKRNTEELKSENAKLKEERHHMEEELRELEEEKEYYRKLYLEECKKVSEMTKKSSELTASLRKKESFIAEQEERITICRKDNELLKTENNGLKEQLVSIATQRNLKTEISEQDTVREEVCEKFAHSSMDLDTYNCDENKEEVNIVKEAESDFPQNGDEPYYEPAEGEVQYYTRSEEELEIEQTSEEEKEKDRRVGFINNLLLKGKMSKFRSMDESERLQHILDLINKREIYQDSTQKREMMLRLSRCSKDEYEDAYLNLLENKPIFQER